MTYREAQAALLLLGYDLGKTGADGDWGKLSKAACAMFQRGRGLAVTGELTAETIAALQTVIGSKDAGPPATGELLPLDWLPTAQMKRVIVHWTAGNHQASALDRRHYHILIESDGKIVRGIPSIALNDARGTKSGYAAHTLNCNTGSIGVSLCCMAGAIEFPFKAGSAPMTASQWATLPAVLAELCERYQIPVTPKTVLSHAEVQVTLGIKQKGKWDIARVVPVPALIGAKACGDAFRAATKSFLGK